MRTQSADKFLPRSEDLKKTLADHVLFLASEGKLGKKICFAECDLKKQNFNGCDLRLADFRSADLTDTGFRDADLRGATLDFAHVDGTDFAGAKLCRTSLIGIVGRRANFWRGTLKGAEMSGCHLTEANFEEADFDTDTISDDDNLNWRQSLSQKHPSDATNLSKACLLGANFRGALMESVWNLGQDGIAGSLQGGARLPTSLQKYEATSLVNDAAKSFWAVIISTNVVNAYGILALLDGKLESQLKLPAQLGQVSFFAFLFVFPVLSFILFTYQQLILNRFWAAIASLPREFFDGLSVESRAFFMVFVGGVFPRFEEYNSRFDAKVDERILSIFVIYGSFIILQLAFVMSKTIVLSALAAILELVLLTAGGLYCYYSFQSAKSLLHDPNPRHSRSLDCKKQENDESIRLLSPEVFSKL